MRLVKLFVLLLLWPVFFSAAGLIHLAVLLLRLPRRWQRMSCLNRTFAALLTKTLNVKVLLEGDPDRLEEGRHLIVSNHLGYLDGIVIGSLFPVIFVSKREVKSWPVIGQWVALCGTIFVDRRRKDKIPLLVEETDRKLREANVLLFPEGTSTNGERLLPFQSAPFAAPIRARATVVPLKLTYRGINNQPVTPSNRDRLYWYGDMDFVSHFWSLLGLRRIEVSVRVYPKIGASSYHNNSLGRKQLSEACYDVVSGADRLRDSSQRGVVKRGAERGVTLTAG